MATASTMVLYGPTLAPRGSIAGFPPIRTAMSVVVPPISEIIASVSPVNHLAPTIEAAGPLKMVSIGFSRACAALIKAPSPLTTIKGAKIPRLFMTSSAFIISKSIRAINRAFKIAVKALFGPLSLAESWWDKLTGLSVNLRIISAASNSCSGFLTANCEQIA